MKNRSAVIHPDAVAIVPATSGRLEGRDAGVAGRRGFTPAVISKIWRETDHKVQIVNGRKSAVVTYFFSITFAGGTGRQTMQGRDMVFVVKGGTQRWLIAADQVSPEPLQNASAGS